MPGDVGLVAKVLDTVFSWFTSEDGLAEMMHKREGNRLEKAANVALSNWRVSQSPVDWQRYKDAEKALVDWSNRP